MITRRLPLAAAVAAGAIAAGCGSSLTSAASAPQVIATVQRALGDLATGNGRAFCSLATRIERARLSRPFPGHSCAAVMGRVSSDLSAAHRRALRHAQVTHVTINGSTAIVRATDISTTQGSLKGFLSDTDGPTTLTRQPGGAWRISG